MSRPVHERLRDLENDVRDLRVLPAAAVRARDVAVSRTGHHDKLTCAQLRGRRAGQPRGRPAVEHPDPNVARAVRKGENAVRTGTIADHCCARSGLFENVGRRDAGRGRHDGARRQQSGHLPTTPPTPAGADRGGRQNPKIAYVVLEVPQSLMHRT